MRKSGSILKDTLKHICYSYIVPGKTAKDVSDEAESFIRDHQDAVPAFLDYHGFPAAACVSINEDVVHAIPSERVITEGDIVSVDCGVIYNNHYSDACRTVAVGTVSERTAALLRVTEAALANGIEQAVVGNRIGNISYAIQKTVVRGGFDVSLDFIGHGIGKVLHGHPNIPNYGSPAGGPLIEEGHCYAIEPVVFDGPTDFILCDDGWTIKSKFGNLSAHFEDTVIITKNGPENITR